MYFYTPVSKTDEVSKIKSVNVANDTFYELTMPWKSKLLAEIKKNYGVITHVMFVVTCNSNWNQISDESTEEESAKKTLTRTISKTRTKLRDFFFCAQLHISANIQWSFVVKTGLNYSQNMLYYKLYIYFFL